MSVKGDGESVRRTPVGAGRGLGPGGQVRRMFRGLRRRLRGNHERRVRHSVFTQLRRVSIPRGLHSSTVQPRSAPLAHTCAFTPPALSTPLNVPQRSSTPARLSSHAEAPPRRRIPTHGDGPAGRRDPTHGEASAGRRLPTDARGAGRSGRGFLSGAQLPRVSCLRRIRPHRPRPRRTTRLRRTSRCCRKNPRRTAAAPARARTRAAGPPAVPGPARTPPAAARRGGHESNDDQYDEHRQDDAYDHGATLLPFPRSGPPWALLLACAYVCVCACSSCCLPAA